MRLLSFNLNEVQLRTVNATLAKLDDAHRTRVAWLGDDSLDGNVLTIHALDLISVLSYCQRNSDNEMDLFRLRKAAMDKLNALVKAARNEVKKQNLVMCLEAYKKLWPGSESEVDLKAAPLQQSRIELIL